MRFASLPLQPVVDRGRRDRCGQRSEVLRRRACNGGELLEAPVRQIGGTARRLANHEGVAALRLGAEPTRLDFAFFGADASFASRIVERRDASVTLIWWASRPFPVCRVRCDRRYTVTLHDVLLLCPGGERGEEKLHVAERSVEG